MHHMSPDVPCSLSETCKGSEVDLSLLILHKLQSNFCNLLLSHPARGGWIEIRGIYIAVQTAPSHPARGGTVEYHKCTFSFEISHALHLDVSECLRAYECGRHTPPFRHSPLPFPHLTAAVLVQYLPFFPVYRFPMEFWREHHVIFAIPLRM